jgi:hypothetical protein
MEQVIMAGKACLWMAQRVPVMAELFSFTDVMIPRRQPSNTRAPSVQTQRSFFQKSETLAKTSEAFNAFFSVLYMRIYFSQIHHS